MEAQSWSRVLRSRRGWPDRRPQRTSAANPSVEPPYGCDHGGQQNCSAKAEGTRPCLQKNAACKSCLSTGPNADRMRESDWRLQQTSLLRTSYVCLGHLVPPGRYCFYFSIAVSLQSSAATNARKDGASHPLPSITGRVQNSTSRVVFASFFQREAAVVEKLEGRRHLHVVEQHARFLVHHSFFSSTAHQHRHQTSYVALPQSQYGCEEVI